MISATKRLCLLLVLMVYIGSNNANTVVHYEFHIRAAPSVNGSSTPPELIITGSRNSSMFIPAKDANGTRSIYMESAVFTADNNGYRVKYNFSLEPGPELGPRLSGPALKILAG